MTAASTEITNPRGQRGKWIGLGLLLVTIVVAVGLWVLNRQPAFLIPPSDRSWLGGSITITPYQNGSELGLHVSGQWPPEVSSDLWIRYALSLRQGGSADFLCISSTQSLERFRGSGTGVSDYSDGVGTHIDLQEPYRAVFDYEIWKGRPGKGELLTKNSLQSEPITRGRIAER